MKKLYKILIASLAALPAIAFADASSSIVLPDNFTAVIWNQANALFNGTATYTTMIIGTLLAITVISVLIETIRRPGQ
jgi:hypothetical protein